MFEFLKLIILLLFFTCVLVTITQDFQVFPGFSFLKDKEKEYFVPDDVSSSLVSTSDNKTIEVWEVRPKAKDTGWTAILFHGNADTVESFVGIQRWFADLGIRTFSFDYRGYRRSTGWPSEKGLYKDSEAVWEFALKQGGVDPKKVLAFGISLGTSPAAKLVRDKDLPLAVLLAPFTDMKSVVADSPIFKFFKYFLWYEFPTKKYLASLDSSKVIVAHGQKDRIILPWHSEEISKQGNVELLRYPLSGHNEIFEYAKGDLAVKIESFLVGQAPSAENT